MIFNLTSFFITMGISFFFTPYLINSIGVEAYGFFPLANNMIGYSSILTAALNSMAGRYIVIKYYNQDFAGANRYFTSVFVGNVILSIILTIPSFFIVANLERILDIPSNLISSVKYLFGLIIATTLIGLLGSIYNVPTFVKNRIDLTSSRTAILNITRVALLFFLFYTFTPSLTLIGIVALIIAILTVLSSINFTKRLTPELQLNITENFSWKALKELVSSGIWNSFNQLSVILMTQVDLLITNVFIGAAATGEYSLAKTLPAITQSFVSVIASTFSPQLNIYYAQNRVDLIIKEINKSIRLLGLVISLPLGFLIVYGEVFFSLWVPTQDAKFLQILSVLSLIPIILTGSINTIYGVYSMTNKLRTPALAWFFLGVIQVTIIFILLKTTNFGILVIPIVSLILGLSRNLIFTPLYAARCLNLKWYTFYIAILRGFLSSGIAIVVSYIASFLYTPSSWGSFIIAAIVLSTLSFIFTLFVLIEKNERIFLLSKIKDVIKL
ncbi:MAG: oligosaccharide flippase family protein [Phocaeicola sp.]